MKNNTDNLDITTKRIIELKGTMSQEAFATQIGTSQPNVSKLLNGSPPSAATLKAIAEKYSVSVDWLLGLSDQRKIAVPQPKEKTYADAITLFASLIEHNSITVIERDDYNNLVESPSDIHVNDCFLQHLMDLRHNINKMDQETKNNWLARIVTKLSATPLLLWVEVYDDMFNTLDSNATLDQYEKLVCSLAKEMEDLPFF